MDFGGHRTLSLHYGHELQSSALLPSNNLERRSSRDVLRSLQHATRNCKSSYEKGIKSFEVIRKLNPNLLQKRLPSFGRTLRILNELA